MSRIGQFPFRDGTALTRMSTGSQAFRRKESTAMEEVNFARVLCNFKAELDVNLSGGTASCGTWLTLIISCPGRAWPGLFNISCGICQAHGPSSLRPGALPGGGSAEGTALDAPGASRLWLPSFVRLRPAAARRTAAAARLESVVRVLKEPFESTDRRSLQ